MSEHDCTIPLKRCTKCGEEKPATNEYFNRDRQKADGLRPECKQCQRQHQRAQYATNPDKINERNKRWRDANIERARWLVRQRYAANPEKFLAHNRRWYADNRKQVLEQSRRWKRSHRDLVRKSNRSWKSRNREQVSIQKHRSRARKRALPATFKVKDYRYALEYFNGCCAACDRPLKDLFGTHTVAMDHWIPTVKGGSSTPDNMIPLCHGIDGCNNRKSDKDAFEWLVQEFGKRRATKILERVQAYFDSLKDD